MTRDYELGFILNPEVSEEQVRGILDRIEQIVANYDGQIVRVQQWGRRRLAYPIEHHRDGFYVFIDMILTPETVSELERNLKVSEIVLRYMTRKRNPKVAQQEREARANAANAAPTPAPAPEASEDAGARVATDDLEQQATPEVEQAQPVSEQPEIEQVQPVSEQPEVEQVQPVSEQPEGIVEDFGDVPPTLDEPASIEA